jgi:hypothetical protein
VARREISESRSPVPVWNGFQTTLTSITDDFSRRRAASSLSIGARPASSAIWPVFTWAPSTGGEGWCVFHHSPVHNVWVNLLLLIVIGVVNAFIVAKPVELYRSVEIRPDCMIIEGGDVFWLRYMENGWPTVQPDDKGNMRLCGIYGTRFVEYLKIRQFDELDCMAEVFDAHLQDAMQQLWGRSFQFA